MDLSPFGRDELIVIRHAPADHQGRLCGRLDVPALLPDRAELAPLITALAPVTAWSSPAQRCRETAAALFPGRDVAEDMRLWEQDFGLTEGLPFADLPDLGPLPLPDLATHAPDQGESFLQMSARVWPALHALAAQVRSSGTIAVTAHAGTARAAIGLALDVPHAGLAFEIDPLSVTRLRCLDSGFSLIGTNQRIA